MAGSAGEASGLVAHIRHLVAIAVAAERVATLDGGNLVLVGIGKCDGAVGLLHDGHPHHVQRLDVLQGRDGLG